MNDEKVRVSGELARGSNASVLPTVNPGAEKIAAEKKAAGIPSVVYVMCALPSQNILLRFLIKQ